MVIHAILLLFALLTGSASAHHFIQEDLSRTELEVRMLIADESDTDRSRLDDDISHDAATDGFASEVEEDCRNVAVRYGRSDGMTVIRKVNRCQ
jgi:hypothetical protein